MATCRKNSNSTIQLYQKLNTVLYFCGLKDFWVDDVKLPVRFKKVFKYLSIIVIEPVVFLFMASEALSFLTQHNLSPKQKADQMVFGVSHPILYVYVMTLIYHKRRVREVLFQLAVGLKNIHNDEEVEAQMISKLKFYLKAYVTCCGLCIVIYGASAFMQYVKTGAPFITVITAWPDAEDRSSTAHIARVVLYFIWWIYLSRISGSYILIMSMLIGLSSQYKNLATYFAKMDRIFDKERQQSELEREYITALKIGIKLHNDTIWCVQQYRVIYSYIFNGQIILSLSELVAVMSNMMTSERTFVYIVNLVIMLLSVMLMAGFVLWNAGDVTVEASYLPEAMYASGWQNCAGASSARVRKLLSFAMLQAQKPVDFMALGCVTMSYETYLVICKSAYSVFSVLY